MDSHRLDEVTGWDSRPFSGGYDGLRDLADRGFTGAVGEGMAWCFMLNGRVVGVFDGDIEDFEGADGTVYEAPHPSLPLLYAMQETGGEIRGRYYTNDTPLSDVDRTLSSGNFTGYVELSENVLSGDYYVVYHGGKSMSAAFVGNSRRLLTGDDAFERADDEVGIYEVTTVDIDVVDIPGGDDAAGTDAAATDGATAGGAAGVSFDEATGGGSAAGDDESAADDPATADVATTGEETPTAATDAPDAPADDGLTTGGSGDAGGPDDQPVPDAEGPDDAGVTTDAAGGASDAGTTGDADATGGDRPAAGTPGEAGADGDLDDGPVDDTAGDGVAGTGGSAAGGAGQAEADDEDVSPAESQLQEVRTIPALDPGESLDDPAEHSESGAASAGRATDRAGRERTATTRPSQRQGREADADRGRPARGRDGVSPDRVAGLQEQLREAETAREAAEQARDRLAAQVDSLTEERDALRQRVETLESEAADLRETIDRLEEELASARAELPDGDRTVSAQAALDGTNLFVRYAKKSKATLTEAAEGSATPEAVNANLRLEHHTSFESDDVTVDGRTYEEFLHDSIHYGFTRWVVEDLLYEIRDTGHEAELRDLYEAIPKIDRAELNGSVSLRYVEEAEEHREQVQFDVVLRDRMGNPLLVANLNEGREAATEAMMRDLVGNAKRLAETSDSFGAGFLVTASFFEPAALETASEATSGGLLTRSKRESFVKLSRKQGFHLCLVETRNADFHLNVPEL